MAQVAQYMLMYFVLPLWLAAGLADWFCHRATRIEITAGPKESVFHLVALARSACRFCSRYSSRSMHW